MRFERIGEEGRFFQILQQRIRSPLRSESLQHLSEALPFLRLDVRRDFDSLQGAEIPGTTQCISFISQFESRIAQHSNEQVRRLHVFTVDAFQGKEVDLVFYSTVRTGSAYGVGFVSDIRRMNVSFTRPRFGLFVVGNEAKLRTSAYWNQFIDFT